MLWRTCLKTTSEYHLSDFFSFKKSDAISVQLEINSSTAHSSFVGYLSGEFARDSDDLDGNISINLQQKTDKLGSDLSFSTVIQVSLEKDSVYIYPSALEIFGGTGNIANSFYTKISSDLIGKVWEISRKEINLPSENIQLLIKLLNALGNNDLSGVVTILQELPQFSGGVLVTSGYESSVGSDKLHSFTLQGDHHIFGLSLLSFPHLVRITGKLNQFDYTLDLSEKKEQKNGSLEIKNRLSSNEKSQISFSLFPLKEKKSLQILPNTYSSLQHYLENLNRTF
ncbi:MAG: hypothetical protein HXJ92_00555 [candidate division SR1 bacterium]|nr:hypothetical protein [candidate division SR1 bacterium]